MPKSTLREWLPVRLADRTSREAGAVPASSVPSAESGFGVSKWWLVLIAIAAWPSWQLGATPGVDGSWYTGLVLAHVDGFRYGREIGYSYGPLGYLVTASAISLSGLVGSILYAALGCGCLAFTLVVACTTRFRRDVGLVAAALIAIAAPLEIFAPEVYSVALLALACLVSQEEASVFAPLFPVLIGAAAALQTLVKPGPGAIALIALAITTCTGRGSKPRALTLGAFGYLGGLTALWLLAGQRLTDFGSWAHLTLNLTAGYGDAMAVELSSRAYEYLALGLVLALLGVYAHGNVRPLPNPRSSTLRLGLLAVAFWIIFKEGFVRHDVAHSTIVFYAVGLFALVFPPRLKKNALLGVLLGSSLLLTGLVWQGSLTTALDPTPSVRSFFTAVTAVVSSGNRAEINAEAQTQLQDDYQVPGAFLQRIGSSSVHVDPVETSAVWAYDLNWRPVPVFQRYLAYTAYADSLNERSLVAPDGPAFVLRESGVTPLDGRNELWDSPRYMLGLVCDFRQVGASSQWQLLKRSTNRCGAQHLISVVRAAPGQLVPVPQPSDPGSIVVATIDVHSSLFSRLESILFKPRPPLTVNADGVTYRLTQASAAGPMIMRLPPGVWTPTFDGSSSYRSLRVGPAATYVFRAIELSTPRAA
jgi:hypothetical protein